MVRSLDYFFIFFALLCGTIIQGAVGFGFALVAAPILMLLQPDLVPGPITFAGLLLSLTMALRERKAVDYQNLIWLFLGFLPGLTLGALFLQTFTQSTLSLLFGFLVLTAVALSSNGIKIHQQNRLITIPAGILSGIMNITTSMGGPPIALIYQNVSGPKFRGTLAIFFFTGSLLTIFGLNQIGRMGELEFINGLYLTPAVALGLLLSQPAADWLDKGKTRYAVLIIAALSGVSVIVKTIWIT
ncbi:MAG: sulfite exporter TauE/SafE family protein [Magnetococcales bacterium]|nr:sulfite exporter TauE/SafE family protein [Magnetococcales bacterium]